MTESSRILNCIRCRNNVRVYEIPRQFIDPTRYVCGWCLERKQPGLLDPLEEQRRYDPDIAALPEGY